MFSGCPKTLFSPTYRPKIVIQIMIISDELNIALYNS